VLYFVVFFVTFYLKKRVVSSLEGENLEFDCWFKKKNMSLTDADDQSIVVMFLLFS